MRCYRAVLCVIVVLSTVRAAYGVEFGGKSPAEAFTGISGQLVEAAVDGNVQKMEQLIGEGADPNSKDKDGNTALLWVLAAHNTRGAEKLLELGADPNVVTPIGPPIWASVQAKDFESLKMLIAHGGDPNKDYDGKTPLMVAIQVMVDGYERLGRERFDYLIAHGADVNFEAYSEFGCSLHKVVPKPEIDENEACTKGAADFAVTFNRFDIAIELLSKGYTKHLDRLARYVAGSPVAKTSKAYREKLSLINILRQKGAKIPLMR